MAMARKRLILIANPGSASRKYALFEGDICRAQLHFEYSGEHVVCTITHEQKQQTLRTDLKDISDVAHTLNRFLQKYNILIEKERIDSIGLRIVAPSSFFLDDMKLTQAVVERLQKLRERAPLHITASLQELHKLRKQFEDVPIYGVSDSAFHRTKPDFAWNYGLPLKDADRLDIKRFGYHGLAVESAICKLDEIGKLTPKVVVAHLGSGASVTAVLSGKSVDNTMGYSPLEGLIMATRSGSIDFSSTQVLRAELGLTDRQLDEYLNYASGLLGLGGSADIRELLKLEADNNHRARLALNTFVYAVQKAIGAMTASLGGIDQLVFTGIIGERSAPIRKQIVQHLGYLDLSLDANANAGCLDPQVPTRISRLARSKVIHVVPIDEAAEILKHVRAIDAEPEP